LGGEGRKGKKKKKKRGERDRCETRAAKRRGWDGRPRLEILFRSSPSPVMAIDRENGTADTISVAVRLRGKRTLRGLRNYAVGSVFQAERAADGTAISKSSPLKCMISRDATATPGGDEEKRPNLI